MPVPVFMLPEYTMNTSTVKTRCFANMFSMFAVEVKAVIFAAESLTFPCFALLM